jgi:tetratricopeptide (TPR) repeat protein
MNVGSGGKPARDVFLSSAFRNFLDVRQKIIDDNPGRVWAAEKSHNPDFNQEKGALPFTIVDELINQIKNSTLFICVLRDTYGTSVFNDNSSVSFLETEIYQAALTHNNVRFFFVEPFNPSEKLKGLLDIVRAVRPGVLPERAEPERVVRDRIRREIDRTKSRRATSWALSVRQLVHGFAEQRGPPRPDIELFDRVFRPISEKPDRDRIRVVLNELDGEQNIERRLTRTWVAIRELCAAPYTDPKFREFLPLWDEALGIWSSAAAWYGLHGHLYAGRLAAVNSQLVIRARMDLRDSSKHRANFIQGTKGARASEYYSMAKLMQNSARHDMYLAMAEQNIEEALAVSEDDPGGCLAIRGHIRLLRGRVGDALSDFEEVQRLRVSAGDFHGAAEAGADVALVYMRRGKWAEATRLLRDSVLTLEAGGRIMFAIRARKRLAYALFKSFHPFDAWRELSATYEIALRHDAFDQITRSMEIAHEMARRFRMT